MSEDEDGSVLGPDPLQTARDLQHALEGMTAQLAAVKAAQSAARRVIIALAISLCLDLLITVGLGWNTFRVNAAENATRAIQVASHASQISACQQANVSRAQDIAIWNRVLKAPVVASAASRAEVADLERLVGIKDKPRDCAKLYATKG